jgi:hypothetical protein
MFNDNDNNNNSNNDNKWCKPWLETSLENRQRKHIYRQRERERNTVNINSIRDIPRIISLLLLFFKLTKQKDLVTIETVYHVIYLFIER